MQKQPEIEERILGQIMGLGIGAIVGFLLRAAERREDSGNPVPRPVPASGAR
jgi:hypothetical protein